MVEEEHNNSNEGLLHNKGILLYTKDGSIVLRNFDKGFALKINSDRNIYLKQKGKNKQFQSLSKDIESKKIPKGYSINKKKAILLMLNDKLLKRYGG